MNSGQPHGKALVKTKITTNDAAPGKMKANFSIRAYEKSGDFSSDNFSLPYNPYDGYVGLRLPRKRSGEKRLDMDKNYKYKRLDFMKQQRWLKKQKGGKYFRVLFLVANGFTLTL